MAKRTTRKKFWIGIISLVIVFVIAILVLRASSPVKKSSQRKTISAMTLLKQRHSKPNPETMPSTNDPMLKWQTYTTKANDSSIKIFKKMGIPFRTLHQLFKIPVAKKYLSNLKPDQKLFFHFNKQHQIEFIKYPLNQTEYLQIIFSKPAITAKIIKKKITSKTLYSSGMIQHSLSSAMKNKHIPANIYAQFIKIFEGTVNFSRDTHPGDHFTILYRQFYIDGKKAYPDNILVAELATHKKTYKAIRFTYPKHHTGYYTINGHGFKPLFIFPPVKYDRISGHFSYHRMDPYLHKIWPHLGIDFATARGTPIHSIGAGKVILAGRDDGYGNAVIVQYNREYRALYGHMERFAKHIHAGSHVKQGQIIGYVGSTGWSTGPHLHFELYRWGIPKNPLTMKFPRSHSIPSKYLSKFHQETHSLLTTLSTRENESSPVEKFT